DIVLPRYLPDGSLDSDFGLHGAVSADLGGVDATALGLLLQPDGAFLLAGKTHGEQAKYFLLRYDASGRPDQQFGAAGETDVPISLDTSNVSLTLLPDKRILIGAGSDFACFNRDGSLDADFGDHGTTIVRNVIDSTWAQEIDNFWVDGIHAQADGRVVLLVQLLYGPYPTNTFALAYLNSDGSIDQNIG